MGSPDSPFAGSRDVELFLASTDVAPLSRWICDAIDAGDVVVAALASELLNALMDDLRAHHVSLARLVGSEQLVLLPADVVVHAVTEGGEVDPVLFDAFLGRLLHRLTDRGGVQLVSQISDEAARQLGQEAGEASRRCLSRLTDDADVSLLSLAGTDDLSRNLGLRSAG